jgi:hypothetical protein
MEIEKALTVILGVNLNPGGVDTGVVQDVVKRQPGSAAGA